MILRVISKICTRFRRQEFYDLIKDVLNKIIHCVIKPFQHNNTVLKNNI